MSQKTNKNTTGKSLAKIVGTAAATAVATAVLGPLIPVAAAGLGLHLHVSNQAIQAAHVVNQVSDAYDTGKNVVHLAQSVCSIGNCELCGNAVYQNQRSMTNGIAHIHVYCHEIYQRNAARRPQPRLIGFCDVCSCEMFEDQEIVRKGHWNSNILAHEHCSHYW